MRLIKTINALVLSNIIFGMNNNAFAFDKTGTAQATASISASCSVKVDNMSFGDVSMQTMSGNGDVFANTILSLLCTKDQTVLLKSNYGMNGTSGGTWTAGNSRCYFGNTGMPYSSCTSRGVTSSTPVNGYRIIKTDGSSISDGETPYVAGANMLGSLGGKITYNLSMDNSFAVKITDINGSSITYNQNDGNWQDYTLYGKANVATAAPDVYIDTNTITITF